MTYLIMYNNKYLKYKEKYVLLKKNITGGSSNKPYYPDAINLRIAIYNHADISRLCDKKIVATPHSGAEPSKLHDMWVNLNEDARKFLKGIYHKQYNWTLGVFVYDRDADIDFTPTTQVANIMIFYVEEYLNLLAEASRKTPLELLNILSVVQRENEFNKDLIKIAFGDIFGNGYNNEPLKTEEGELTLAIYLSLLP